MPNASIIRFEQLRDVLSSIERLLPSDRDIVGLSAIGIHICEDALSDRDFASVPSLARSDTKAIAAARAQRLESLDCANTLMSQLSAMLLVIQGEGCGPYGRLHDDIRDNYVSLASSLSTQVLVVLKTLGRLL